MCLRIDRGYVLAPAHAATVPLHTGVGLPAVRGEVLVFFL
jgi:hypothetical protein